MFDVQFKLINSSFGGALLSRFFAVTATLGTLPHLFALLKNDHGFDLKETAMIGVVMTLASAASSIISGFVVDKWGTRLSISISGIIMGGALIVISLNSSFGVLMLMLSILSIFMCLMMTADRVIVAEMVEPEDLVTGYNLSEMSRIIGKIVGPLVTMYYISISLYENAFRVGALLYFLVSVVILLVTRKSKHLTNDFSQTEAQGEPKSRNHVSSRNNSSALYFSLFIVIILGCIMVSQQGNWLSVFASDISAPQIVNLVYLIQGLISIPVLFFIGPKLKNLTFKAKINLIILSVMMLGISQMLVSYSGGNLFVIVLLFALGLTFFDVFVLPISQVIIVRIFNRKKLGMGFGIFSLASYTGQLISVTLGALLYNYVGTRIQLLDYWFWGCVPLFVILFFLLFHIASLNRKN